MLTGLFYYYKYSIGRPNASKSDSAFVEVKEGDTFSEIADSLYNNGLISSKYFFMIYAKTQNKNIKPGVYQLASSMPLVDIYESLSSGRSLTKKILIPEGYRIEQVAQVLEQNGLTKYSEFVAKAKIYEGKLFPDTYFISKEDTIDEIIELMNKNFLKRTEILNLSEEDLILASIVEREAINDEERILIAGVYKNRLRIGMKLEADPTVKYALDDINLSQNPLSPLEEYKFWKQKVVLSEVRNIASEYNTYSVLGLPPTPICNPGLKSIEGVLNYQRHDFIYFLQKDGEIYPSKNASEHDKYRQRILGARI